MGKMVTAQLKAEGIEGIGPLLSFTFSQLPGEHARAELKAEAGAGGIKEQELSRQWIRVVAGEGEKPLFCGRVESLKEQREGGYSQITLRLVSGSVLLDQKKESHSYQDISMSYGALVTQVAEEGGGVVLYPESLDHQAIGFPRIQYEETDWAFLARMGSHFGLSLYPDVEGDRAGVSVGIPQGTRAEDFSWRGYALIRDGKYEELGGSQAGYTLDRFLGYEVESEDNYSCGQLVSFQGRELTICAKSCSKLQQRPEGDPVYLPSGLPGVGRAEEAVQRKAVGAVTVGEGAFPPG